jgi:GT2 family glycosyltransferase
MPEISVIVPARDAAATVEKTLRALGRQDGVESFEVIVVDNGSLDETAAIAERAGARVVRRARGEGPGAARNAGAAVASSDLLAFTDADCEPDPGWLAAGLAALGSAALVQGAVVADPQAELGPFDRTVVVSGATGLFEAASLFVDRGVFDRTGGFAAGLEAAGEAPFGEDALFGWAVCRSGATVAFCGEAVVVHAVTRRRAFGFVRERTRLGLFPALVARVPELRGELCFAGCFLTRRTAAFDLAVAGMLIAVCRRRPAGLVLVLPYVAATGRQATPWGRRLTPRVVLGTLIADAVGAGALVAGSLRTRTLVL